MKRIISAVILISILIGCDRGASISEEYHLWIVLRHIFATQELDAVRVLDWRGNGQKEALIEDISPEPVLVFTEYAMGRCKLHINKSVYNDMNCLHIKVIAHEICHCFFGDRRTFGDYLRDMISHGDGLRYRIPTAYSQPEDEIELKCVKISKNASNKCMEQKGLIIKM